MKSASELLKHQWTRQVRLSPRFLSAKWIDAGKRLDELEKVEGYSAKVNERTVSGLNERTNGELSHSVNVYNESIMNERAICSQSRLQHEERQKRGQTQGGKEYQQADC